MLGRILSYENLFLIILGFIWIIGAIIQDFRRREVDNIWNFSLIAFAIAYRLVVSIYTGDYRFVLNGILGFVIFLGIGNLCYYSRLFAGGDVKLLIALGIILPLSYNWLTNLKIFGIFILLFLSAGAVYTLIYSVFLIFQNKKEFSKQFIIQWKIYQKMFFIALFFILFWIILIFCISKIKFILIGLVILLFPVLFIFAKAIEKSCMIKFVLPRKVTEGDWLCEDVIVAGHKIKSNWEGVSKEELELIRKKCRKKILIKQGIPFTPSFLFGLIGLLFLMWKYNGLI